jgi:NADH-quinone oxidoreductase subunit L
VGWFVARTFYKDARSTVPATLAAKFPGFHRVVSNKYYVDELYQKTILRGSMLLGQAYSAFDRIVIDGAVNAVGVIVRLVCNIESAIDKYLVDGAVTFVASSTLQIGRQFRRLQTGRIQTYLYGAMAGALVLVGIKFLLASP